MGGVIYSRPPIAEIREVATALGKAWSDDLFARTTKAIDAVVDELNRRASKK